MEPLPPLIIYCSGTPLQIEHEVFDDEYPTSYKLEEILQIKSLNGKTILIEKNEKYAHNKFLAATKFLQYDIIMEHYEQLDDKLDTLERAIDIIINFQTFYHYCFNVKNHLAVLKFLLDKFVSLVPLTEDCLENFVEIIDKSSSYLIQRFKMDLMIARKNKFDGYEYVVGVDDMIELLQQYDESSGGCKYCMGCVPKNKLISTCECVARVHIHCFKKWFFTKEIVKCEICGDPYSKINQIRNHSRIDGVDVGRDILFFPFDNFYPIPLMSTNDLVKVDDKRQYVMALCYLQCKRMANLLESGKFEEFDKFREMVASFLQGSMPSNYSVRHNYRAYFEMSLILCKYKIINAEDVMRFIRN